GPAAGSQAAGGGDPAGMAAHDFEDENLGGSAGHGGHVQPRFADGGGDILGHGAEARAAVGERQIVVHRLRYADADERMAHLLGQLGNLPGGVHGIVAAVVEEIADVVGA